MPTLYGLVNGAGERLREARELLRLDQRQFASLLQISHSQYSKIERNERPLNPKFIDVLEKKGINVNYILTGKGELKLSPEPNRLVSNIRKVKESQQKMIEAIIETFLRENEKEEQDK